MSQKGEAEGIARIRSAALFYIVAILITLVAVFAVFIPLIVSISSISSNLSNPNASSASAAAGGILSAVIGVIVVAVIVSIVILVFIILSFLRFRDGFSILQAIGRDVGIGKTGTTLILVGAILLIIPFLDIIGIILIFVGQILLGIGIYRIGEIYNNSLTKIGGILVAIPLIDITAFIGMIMTYVGVGQIQREFGMRPPLPPSSQIPSQQTGSGVLRGNGTADLNIYLQTQEQVVSAQILGTNYLTGLIVPNMLQPGFNNLTVNFNVPLNLMPNSIYVIRLNLASGRTLDVNVTFQP
ncbi:DUF973 family protein [Sulfolobus acidocaldarius]|uniref:ISC1173-like transposase n=4 Tax=Sulfolobus acidocaldarius TaxID=2285 RepID=Q4J755_SULAC|nr:DUF973 family protein [Sulfolobus acidocaldarius]AAY81376.1 ISC1173-like transposase [Sulfolobus acidocaldarius DSM 639]AGE71975.1 ISC1173-like transposase [Sulfolobus acidocaldarius N8]AGE74291.1 ISC1173-like transposase [Sulfolobus acidocaldarius Ron12/I]ALU29827.1 transposase [Sulfolobus acidocaldarius]ALU32566.1 transposase [Sulfolobus acidocaldarius]